MKRIGIVLLLALALSAGVASGSWLVKKVATGGEEAVWHEGESKWTQDGAVWLNGESTALDKE